MNSIKVNTNLRKICAPIFEVNLQLRTPAESGSSENSEENLHESDKCSEKSAIYEDTSENEVNVFIKQSSEELLPMKKSKRMSYSYEILSGKVNDTIKSERKYLSSWKITCERKF